MLPALARSPSLPRPSRRVRGARRAAMLVHSALALGACSALTLGAGPAWGLDDSRDPNEAAPIEELGPPVATDAPQVRIEAVETRVELAPSRRAAHLSARWRVRGPAGPVRLVLPSTQSHVDVHLVGTAESLRPDDIQREDPVPDQTPSRPELQADIRIDASSGEVYARDSVPRAPRPRFRHVLTLLVPATGAPEGMIEIEAIIGLSAGFDRRRWRETGFERAHALHMRRDPFVYQFAARGPGGPLTLRPPQHGSASARVDEDGSLRIAAAERYVSPVGLTVGLGPAVWNRPGYLAPEPPSVDENGQPVAPKTALWQGLLRASLDVLLPHRDALSLSAELGTDLRGSHHVGAALVYQLYAPAWPFLPLAAHADLGATCDLWQSAGPGQDEAKPSSLRCGIRAGLAAHVRFVGIAPSLDLFPVRERDPQSAEPRFTARYRFALLLQVGL